MDTGLISCASQDYKKCDIVQILNIVITIHTKYLVIIYAKNLKKCLFRFSGV